MSSPMPAQQPPEPFYAAMTCPTCGKDVGQDGVFLVEHWAFCRACAVTVRDAINAWLAA